MVKYKFNLWTSHLLFDIIDIVDWRCILYEKKKR